LASSESFEAQSAKSYVLVGFIFYVLSAAGLAIALLFFGFITGWMNQPPFNADVPSALAPLSVIFLGIPLALAAGFSTWSWITMDNIDKGKYVEARTATIILGIFGIFFAGLIGGIFLLLAYGKLGDVIRGSPAAVTPPQRTGRICPHCGRPITWDAKFCEHCGKKID
jgi:hypothetical protein